MRILCMSFHVPPAIRPQAILLGKMIPEWQRQGASTVLLTYTTNEKWDIDLPIYTIPKFKGLRYFDRISFIHRFRAWNYYRKVVPKVIKILKHHKIQIIYSFANPQASNILAARVHKLHPIPFVAHFSDPWYDNPLRSDRESSRRLILSREKMIIKESDAVIFTCPNGKNLVMKKYSDYDRAKAYVIPHCFDPNDYTSAKKQHSRFIISHIGAFYPQRGPEPLLIALSKMLTINPELREKFLLQLVGAVSYTNYPESKLQDLLKKYDLVDSTKIIPPTTYQGSIEYMTNSDCLIVIDADLPNSPFLPSKVIDYIGSKTPIIAITPQDSATTEILTKLKYPCVTHDDTDQLALYLTKCIQKTINYEVDESKRSYYSVQTTTRQLFDIFSNIIAHHHI